jgi:hypothetical protein
MAGVLVLDLTKSKLGQQGAAALGRSFRTVSLQLQRLTLDDNALGDVGTKSIIDVS